eukprot:COSAG02_NODE_270_length_26392_cov_29.151980_9_plen_84_part_00
MPGRCEGCPQLHPATETMGGDRQSDQTLDEDRLARRAGKLMESQSSFVAGDCSVSGVEPRPSASHATVRGKEREDSATAICRP